MSLLFLAIFTVLSVAVAWLSLLPIHLLNLVNLPNWLFLAVALFLLSWFLED